MSHSRATGASHPPACLLCGKSIDPVIARLQGNVQPRIMRTLTANFPQWSPEHELCPDCMAQVIAFANRERQRYSVQHELNLPYPVYSRDEAGILPAPTRVHADTRFTGRGITVAFLDSGFYAHPDLTQPHNRIKLYVDATGARPVIRDKFDAPPVAQSWHGTMTSSIAIGNGWSSRGLFAGLAPEAELVAIKCGYRGKRISEADILRALTWVVDNHKRHDIRVVSISLGGDRPSDGNATPLDEMVEEAVARGLVVVCASGNDARTHIFPPASAPSAITVGGLDDQNSMDRTMHGMYRSNWGTGVGGAQKPDLIAPAQWVAAPMVMETPTHEQAQFLWDLFEADDRTLRHRLETEFARARFNKDMAQQPIDVIRRQVRGRMNDDKLIHRHYQHVDGTSMSTPFVTGVAAQMLQANPRLAPKQVRQILRDTAQPLLGVPAEQQGAGALNAGAAVARALRHRHAALRKAPAATTVDGGAVTFTFCDDIAGSVTLAGAFNGWRTDAGRMKQIARGAWQARLRLSKGAHRYKFVIDGARWLHDLENPRVEDDGCGGYFSVIDV